ncbi:ubiquitin-like domain-containing protein, partial [Isoptericola sp. BMS4]|uniref:ubiquitin-like domain-containing protein n=1 Tax=Isoptericola sp. BMS4 TaxID=2527875 RepID=UPI00142387AF
MTNPSDATPASFEPTAPEPTTDGSARSHRRRWPLVAGAAAAALAVTGAGMAYGEVHKTVTLDVDGNVQTVSTTASSVDDLLEAQGVVLDDRDLVAPGGDAALTEGSDVVVRTGKEITVAVDGEQSDTWVTALDTDEALDGLAARGDDVAIVASRSGDRATLPLGVDTDGPVAVVHDGTTDIVQGGDDVQGVLADADVTLDEDDRVHVTDAKAKDVAKGVTQAAKKAAKRSQDGTTVENVTAGSQDAEDSDGAKAAVEAPQVAVVVERVETKKVTKTSVVEHKTRTRTDDDRYADLDTKVAREGKDGERTKVFRVTTVDGEVV